ncbi:hypothetical protein [Bifidobacterium bifidum]|uniref:hypothetical protein n=1 Tax=Bifidobacterium bifidum TaxID=1681 RepID=UPI00165100C9|nr:hypothetical protein [Bifidobacterium bifidum]
MHPGYARTTFDAVGLPEGAYVRVVFPELDGVRYETAVGARKVVSNTDVQLAKVTFLQERSEDPEPNPDPSPNPNPNDGKGDGTDQIRPALAGPTNTLPDPDECFYPQRATRCG